jgi:hypothetical protein
MESGLITPSALIRTGAAKGVTSPPGIWAIVQSRIAVHREWALIATTHNLLKLFRATMATA